MPLLSPCTVARAPELHPAFRARENLSGDISRVIALLDMPSR
jgi:hypothetical protein